ncbi:MAG TPA: cytochrome c [Terracidiphilus sp.]|jgi:mono/diheme cytochrome c family protein
MTPAIRRRLGFACLAFTASLFLCAAASSHWKRVPAKDHVRASPFASTPEAVAAGALIYKDHCEQCHRSDGMGDGRKKPPLRSDSLKSASDGDLEWFLRQGDLRHGMPSWSSLPEAQRWQLIAYLRSIQQ